MLDQPVNPLIRRLLFGRVANFLRNGIRPQLKEYWMTEYGNESGLITGQHKTRLVTNGIQLSKLVCLSTIIIQINTILRM
jgi:hypothetical protein